MTPRAPHSIQPFLRFFLSTFLAGICALPALAQNSQGTILGHVVDSSGAALVGANVTITNIGTSVSRKIKTSSVGDFVFVNVIPGNYRIEVEAPGFQKVQVTTARLDVDATLRQNFRLQPGTVQQQITVSAESQMVQTDNATSGEVVSGKLIEDLPISGRDFTNLLRIQAGVTQVQGSSQLYWAQHGLNNDFTSVSVNGARTESVSYLVDGVSDNDQYFSTANNIPNSGAIEEFKVQNGLYSAEYGQGSAQVNVAIKSGTNQYHGTVYDYIQNDMFEPTNPLNVYNNKIFDTPLPAKDSLKQNQYGFTFGGPIIIPKLYDGRNKTFFFYSYEAGRQRKSFVDRALVPSAQERNGDFSDWRNANGNLVPIFDPATGVAGNPATRQAFAGNQIPSSRFSGIASNYLSKIYPVPNITVANMADCAQTDVGGGNSCFNYLANVSHPYDTDNNTFRVDENVGQHDRLYYTAILGEQKLHNASIMPFTGEVKYQHNYLLAFNWEHTFTPNTINQFRIGYNWMNWRNGSDTANSQNFGADLGFANVPGSSTLWGVPDIQLNGFKEIGNTNSGWTQKENNYQVVENLKWVHGKHTITVGADIRRLMLNMIAAFGSTGQVSFNGAYTGLDPNLTNQSKYDVAGTGSSLADFLLGNPINVSGPAPGGSDRFDVRGTNWNFFFQDDLRLTPKLTVNLGLRYEIPPAFHDIYNSGAQLDMTNGGGFKWANKQTVALIQQQPGFIPSLVRCCVDNKLVTPDHKDLAPRIGVSWRPFDTDRFVVRTGYGIFYDLQNQWYGLTTYDNISTLIGASAFYPTSTGATTSAPNRLDTLWLPSTLDFSFFGAGPNGFPFYIPYPQINWPGNRSPYNQQWTLGTQYALSPNLLFDISYIGSHSLRQPGYWYYNAATMPATDDPCDRYRAVAEAQGDPSCANDPNFIPALARNRFSNISSHAYAVANLFSGNYNSLQVRLNQRFSHGLLYQLNYTWSRALDNVSAINNIPTANLTLQNNNCFSCDRSAASFDQTHRFVASGSYEFPVGKGRKWSLGPANWVLGNWDFSGIYTVGSGFPESLSAGFGGFGEDGVRADLRRPNQVGDPNAAVFGVLDPTVYPQANFKSDIYHWFNPAAYAAPAGNQYGNVARNSIRQPYYMRGDITFSKNFRITERQSFQYRLEIFNVFSLWHSALNGGPNGGGGIQGNLASSTFGSLVPIINDPVSGDPLAENLQAGTRYLWNPRTIQMTAKYTF
jgi:carboxypeptidase family protein/TonB-dependent receptor-like protein